MGQVDLGDQLENVVKQAQQGLLVLVVNLEQMVHLVQEERQAHLALQDQQVQLAPADQLESGVKPEHQEQQVHGVKLAQLDHQVKI